MVIDFNNLFFSNLCRLVFIRRANKSFCARNKNTL
uniref:Uncharacterized protein n=1 Tax=Siphoviridae sp. ct2vX3 TaxID=2825318 RepID=A0A8S5PY91_9CAUD|nr:MAG TPA: hypothetical protein [Siphoviridae sp. ct2vX3]